MVVRRERREGKEEGGREERKDVSSFPPPKGIDSALALDELGPDSAAIVGSGGVGTLKTHQHYPSHCSWTSSAWEQPRRRWRRKPSSSCSPRRRLSRS